MTFSIAQVLLEAAQVLRKAGVPEARREAGSLLAFVIDRDRTFLISHAEDVLSSGQLDSFRRAIERRASGEPSQYISGSQDFYGRTFKVSPAVLIPRPETELLVEAALDVMSENSVICDVGTGSGCIAITLMCERSNARGVAVDISDSALAIAKENALEFDVNSRLVFAVSDCFESLPENSAKFDVIVSNPPYISRAAVDGLQREVKDYEPLIALSPGPDGLTTVRRLITEAPKHLQKDGYLLLEIGYDQGEAVQRLIDPKIWQLVEIRPDLQGIPRIVVLRRSC